jgi:hypothetical protein
MKHTILVFCILMFPLVSFADTVRYEQTCERAEGCALVSGAVTLKDYCPTCTIKTIVTRTPKPPVVTLDEPIPSGYSETSKFLIAWYKKDTKESIEFIKRLTQ